MKIAIIGSKGIPSKYGGVQKVVENVAVGLVELGCDVTVYSRSYYSDIKEKKFKYRGCNVINIKGINTKRLDTLTHSFLSAIHAAFQDYDIVAFHSFIPAFFAFIPRLAGKKVVYHSHGVLTNIKKIKMGDRWLISIFRYLTGWTLNGITTVSKSQLEMTKKLYHRNDVVLIPNGIEFLPKPIVDEQKFILCVGRIVESKGIEFLIEAFNSISEEFPEFKLKIVGEHVNAEKYYNRLLLLASANPNIEFLGSKYGDDLVRLYASAYLVVIPSEKESFSIVLYEALYYNGLVLCSDWDQFKQTVDGLVHFFANANTYSLREELKKMLLDDQLRCDMRLVAKNIDFNMFRWPHIVERYLDYYRSISFGNVSI